MEKKHKTIIYTWLVILTLLQLIIFVWSYEYFRIILEIVINIMEVVRI